MTKTSDVTVGTDERKLVPLIDMAHELGYRAKLYSPSSISVGMSGYTALAFHFPGHSLQMYTAFSKNPDREFGLQQANEFNESFRFVKCYLTETGIRFEGDFFFDFEGDSALEDLRKIFQSWEVSLGNITSKLNDRITAGKLDAPPSEES